MTRALNINRLRLAAQRIEGSEFTTPTEVVRWMLAMQAQDLPGGKWSVGVRAPGTTLREVDAALARGEIVRSWPMRGTLHLVPAEDIGWMVGLTAERTLRSLARRYDELGLDPASFKQAEHVAVGALEGGRALSRAARFDEFEAAGISTTGQRGPHILGHLHQLGTLVLGPMHGTGQNVVLHDEWVREPRTPERDEALGEWVLRYFRSHGPATLKDFTWWTKLTVRDAGIGLAIARNQLEEIQVDDVSYWMAPGLPDRMSRRVHALPGFDEYLLGYQDRSAALDPAHAPVVVPGNNGVFQPTVVVNGRIVGTWRRKVTPAGITITPRPFAPLSDGTLTAFGRSASVYGHFIGTAAQVAEQDVHPAG
ncbi:MAG TPA: winged helix DNA-binding domain-containing protein [Actinopolymorphaceae bacterium]|jgi:hypothetical protein